MAKTLVSSSTLFCPVTELLKRVDTRVIAQLASDNNVPVAAASLAANANVLALLGDACGFVESAAYAGERYTKADLELIVATDCHAQKLLYRLVADQAAMLFIERREDDDLKPTAGMLRSMEWLNELYDGKKIFAFQESQDAGHLDTEEDTEQDIIDRALPSYTARRYFGTRNNRWQT